jgi:osmoprotectant transport system ATP-binding protein
MQVGGKLAQFGPPAEILTNPASDFVARFVGTDRGLKRLSLTRVSEVEARQAFTVHAGDSFDDVRRRAAEHGHRFALLVDADERPVGWIRARKLAESGSLTAAMAESMSPLFEPRDTLKDALGRLLGAGVEMGIVVDEDGRVRGLLTFSDFGELLRAASDGGSPGESGDVAASRAAELTA